VGRSPPDVLHLLEERHDLVDHRIEGTTGILACLDLETGERRWKGGRYGHGHILLLGDVLLVLTEDGEIELNAGRKRVTLKVTNTGDRPIQVGSHYHFYETNPALEFERELTRGFRLDIPAGTAVRFEPGQHRDITLVAYAGERQVFGFNQAVMGPLED